MYSLCKDVGLGSFCAAWACHSSVSLSSLPRSSMLLSCPLLSHSLARTSSRGWKRMKTCAAVVVSAPYCFCELAQVPSHILWAMLASPPTSGNRVTPKGMPSRDFVLAFEVDRPLSAPTRVDRGCTQRHEFL